MDEKKCTRCGKIQPLDDFHHKQSRCKHCRCQIAKARRKALQHDPRFREQQQEQLRRRRVARAMCRAPRMYECYKKAKESQCTGNLEEYAHWSEHRSLGWCTQANWRKKRKTIKAAQNCKQCGRHSGTTTYCSDRCKYRWRYRNDPDFRRRECARRQMRKSTKCDHVAAVLRRVLAGGGGGKELPDLIGCDAKTFYAHMVRRRPSDMSDEDMATSDMHIDHIFGRKYFNLNDPDEWHRCWHYSNMRPLWAADNLRQRITCRNDVNN